MIADGKYEAAINLLQDLDRTTLQATRALGAVSEDQQASLEPTSRGAVISGLAQQVAATRRLPIGAVWRGTKYKSPIDPKTGKGLNAWQTVAYTPAEIAAMNGVVKCVGTRCGPDAGNLCILDIDGESAIRVCKDAECSSRETGGRSTTTSKAKVAFSSPKDCCSSFTTTRQPCRQMRPDNQAGGL